MIEAPGQLILKHFMRTTILRISAWHAPGLGRKMVKFRAKESIFTQGDVASNVLYIQEGSVKITVVNESGKEAVVAVLGPGDFFGEGCLAGQSKCMATAAAIAQTTLLVIEKSEMTRALH